MPKVSKDILVWVRTAARLSEEEAASKLNFKDSTASSAEEKLLSYESGEKEPSRSLLVKMSKVYRKPLLTFYLTEPPTTGDRGEDFRTLPVGLDPKDNAYVDVLIRDVKARQSAVHESLLEEDEATAIDFVGKHSHADGVEAIVNTLRKALSIDLSEYRRQTDQAKAFRVLREAAERAGIFVLLKGNLGSSHTNIDVNVFRGFAFSDPIAPFVVINDRDAKSAWPFTLMHELAHITLGQTGISGAVSEKQAEQFCDRIASEFLLPEVDFQQFQIQSTVFEEVAEEISSYAYSKKISSSMVVHRLLIRGDINDSTAAQLRNFFLDKWLAFKEKERAKNRQSEGSPSAYVLRRYQMGELVQFVQRMMNSGAITTTKAAMILDTKPLKVHRLFEIPA